MRKSRKVYELVNGVIEIPRSRGSVLIHNGYEFGFKKIHKSNNPKLVGKTFKVFYCKGEMKNGKSKCPGIVSIRELNEKNEKSFYISSVQGNILHYHEPPIHFPDSGDEKTSFPDPDDEKTSEIVGVLPSHGKLLGGNIVDLYFNVSTRLMMKRFQERPNCVQVLIGGKNAVTQSYPYKLCLNRLRLEQWRGKEDKYETCNNAQLVMPTLVPPGNTNGLVDVEMNLLGENVVLKNGYRYDDDDQQRIGIFGNPFQSLTQDEDEDGFLPDLDDFQLFESPSFGINNDQENEQNVVDQFLANSLFYAVGRNNLELVNHYVMKKKYNIRQKDVFGITPVDVAKFYHLENILRFFDEQKSGVEDEKKKVKLENSFCKWCESSVLIDLEKWKITHRCNSKSGRESNHENTPLSKLRVSHLPICKNVSIDVKKLLLEKKCSLCDGSLENCHIELDGMKLSFFQSK